MDQPANLGRTNVSSGVRKTFTGIARLLASEIAQEFRIRATRLERENDLDPEPIRPRYLRSSNWSQCTDA